MSQRYGDVSPDFSEEPFRIVKSVSTGRGQDGQRLRVPFRLRLNRKQKAFDPAPAGSDRGRIRPVPEIPQLPSDRSQSAEIARRFLRHFRVIGNGTISDIQLRKRFLHVSHHSRKIRVLVEMIGTIDQQKGI